MIYFYFLILLLEKYPYSINAFFDANSDKQIFSLLTWPIIGNCYTTINDTKVKYEEKYTFTSYGLVNKVIPKFVF